MTNLKKLMMTAVMMGIIITGLTSAKAGSFNVGLRNNDIQTTTEAKDDRGILVTLTGIIITGLTGIVIHD